MAIFDWHLDAFLLSIALERVTIERLMLVRVVAAVTASGAYEHIGAEGVQVRVFWWC
jgi:hypothetical protein